MDSSLGPKTSSLSGVKLCYVGKIVTAPTKMASNKSLKQLDFEDLCLKYRKKLLTVNNIQAILNDIQKLFFPRKS